MLPQTGEFHGTSRFRLLGRLGAGGMGIVYLADDRERGVRVALKTLRTLSGEAVLRLKNEFRSLQNLQHPNLVSLGELIEQEGQWFFTMEFVDGVDFLTWVRAPGERLVTAETADTLVGVPAASPAPSPAAAVSPSAPAERSWSPAPVAADACAAHPVDEGRLRLALRQLASGLHALHAAGKVHRDIKPSNILVTAEGRLVLLDFGLVVDVVREPDVLDSQVVGTTAYMAPEQGAGRPVGPEADWYSVGVLLYQALTGRLPFTGPPLAVLMDKQRYEPKPVREIARDAPPDLAELCGAMLRFDPARRPAGEHLLARLHVPAARDATMPTLSTTTAGQPFVGRTAELETLREAFEDSRAGRPVAVIVHGESGVGKSALVRRFLDTLVATTPGAVVLSGRCHERESVPYKAFDEIVDALGRYLARLPREEAAARLPVRAALLGQVFPVLRQVEAVARAPRPPLEALDPHELRSRVFASLRELLCRVADVHPLVVAIDDFQWADVDSRALLSEVMRPPDAPPLLLLATIRDGAGGGGDVAGVVRGDVRGVTLGMLAADEARELAHALLERAAGHDAAEAGASETIADEARGHPLFIDELVRHLLLEGSPSSGLHLDEALWTRIGHLDEPARHLLELVVMAGVPLAQEVIARAAIGAGFLADANDVARATSLLRVAHLVRSTGARGTDLIEPYHDRVRTAVLSHLSLPARRALHERLALALESWPLVDAELLVLHWRGSGEDERAAPHALKAAEEAAAALAFDRAARLYQVALELRPSDGSSIADLQARRAIELRLGDALTNAGRGAEAAQAYLKAAAVGASEAEALDLRRRAAEQLLRCGHIDEGLDALRTVLAAVDMRLASTPRRALASFLARRAQLRLRGLDFTLRDESHTSARELTRIDVCWSVAIGLGIVDTIRGADFQTRHLLLALRAGEPYRITRALAVEAAYSSTAGVPARRRTARLVESARKIAQRIDIPHATALSVGVGGFAAFLEGRYREALAQCDEAEGICRERCTGVAWELYNMQHYAMLALSYLGELRELGHRAERVYKEAALRGDIYGMTMVTTRLRYLASLAADDPAAVRADTADAMARWSQAGWHLQHYFELLSLAEADLYEGRHESALALVEDQWEPLRGSMNLRVQHTRAEAWSLRGRAHLAAAGPGRQDLLAGAERAAAILEHERVDWIRPLGAILRAGVAARHGDGQAAAALLDAAERDCQAVDMALHAAAARRQRGVLVGGDEGRALRESAEAWMAAQDIRDPGRFARLLVPGCEGQS